VADGAAGIWYQKEAIVIGGPMAKVVPKKL
jgi:hypothetical protein